MRKRSAFLPTCIYSILLIQRLAYVSQLAFVIATKFSVAPTERAHVKLLPARELAEQLVPSKSVASQTTLHLGQSPVP